MEPVAWGVIGTGRIARLFIEELAFTPAGVAVAVGSRDLARARDVATAYNVPAAYGSYVEVVADPAVQAVYVATHHPQHLAHALLAIEAGKPVLVEKSFTMNAPEARTLVDAARAAGVFAMEAMWTRFLPHVVALRELIAQGRLGEIRLFTADHGKWFPPDPTSRLFAPELGGSALLDLGVYPVSFASMILGTPVAVRAVVEPALTGVDTQASMVLRYASGAHAVLTCSSAVRSAVTATVAGTEARVEISGDFYAPARLAVIARTGEREEYSFTTHGRGLYFQVEEVARCVERGALESDVMPLDESVAIMATMDAVLRGEWSPTH